MDLTKQEFVSRQSGEGKLANDMTKMVYSSVKNLYPDDANKGFELLQDIIICLSCHMIEMAEYASDEVMDVLTKSIKETWEYNRKDRVIN